MAAHQDPFTRSVRREESELDLYTIPINSSWFSWDEIHETERAELKEFFDLSSISRTPKIYKEYRDFIINKYREDPSRRLPFTEVRKSLVGDVSLLHKVFLFLEKWGLINFGANSADPDRDDELKCQIKFEEALPNGVRVVAVPNSGRPLSAPETASQIRAKSGGDASKLLPLSSFSDVFGTNTKPKSKPKPPNCGQCSGNCDSGYYECTKPDRAIICANCFENGNCGENKSKDDFTFRDCKGSSNGGDGSAWTEEETLLLLESVLKHGDDWEVVAQSVKTKNKLDCILKLIELPFGEFMAGSASSSQNAKSSDLENEVNNEAQLQSPSGFQNIIKPDGQREDPTHEVEKIQNEDDMNRDPPLKKKRIASLSNGGSSLMKQAALMSAMVGPNIAAVAAESAVKAICNETSCSRDIFDYQEVPLTSTTSLTPEIKPERGAGDGDSEMKDEVTLAETMDMRHAMPLNMRAATATALGAAAAHAKLLADQEDREVEHLLATVIETQVKKLQYKIKHFDEVEVIMEKEYAEMEDLKELITSERVDILQRAVRGGITKWRDGFLKA